MTPKEKAKELVEKFYHSQSGIEWGNEEQYKEAQSFHDNNSDAVDRYWQTLSKQCALIAVDEILSASPMYPRQSRPMKRANGTDMVMTDYPPFLYWQEVKNEIKLL